jgi:hypothetical protein
LYYLRKEPYEYIIPEIKKTDGTVIPERKHMTGDRALYKAIGLSRFYRRAYPIPKEKGMKLYKVKKLESILRQRELLRDYCGEWFDVYDDNGKVDISNIAKCTKGFSVEKYDDNGFVIPNKYYTINAGEIWSIENNESRILDGEIRLTPDVKSGCLWIQIPREMFEKHFENIS